uniref:PKS_ER domain-containing protein n=1 Tax=Panagrellus redivivus TaxID=6233 RepID=A0A7E4VV42_PANRE
MFMSVFFQDRIATGSEYDVDYIGISSPWIQDVTIHLLDSNFVFTFFGDYRLFQMVSVRLDRSALQYREVVDVLRYCRADWIQPDEFVWNKWMLPKRDHETLPRPLTDISSTSRGFCCLITPPPRPLTLWKGLEEDVSTRAAVSLSCVVIVDVIDRSAISTVCCVLFVDAAPAQMVVEAINKDGHRFFDLTDIPFDWFFEYPDGGKPIRIVPFAQSKYEAPLAIQRVESNKQRGFVVLVEGVSTGFARLTAKFAEPHFSAIAPDTIDLSVVANVILNPSHDIILIDRHIKPKSGITPQSAHIHVSEPDAIVFTIDEGNVWYIQSGIEYKINARLQDTRGNYMYITGHGLPNQPPNRPLSIIEASPNGNYFHVRAKTGVAAFPHSPAKPYVYPFTATGGTGSYRWSTFDTKIAAVNESRGRLTSLALGHTVFRVEDVFDVAHFALVQVYVLESTELRFGESHVEAEVGDKLILNVRMSGLNPSSGKLIPFSDCRNTGFGVTVGDLAVLKKDRAASQRPEFGGCATIPLVAQTSGDTTVKLALDQYNDEFTISAFALQLSHSHDLLLETGSEYHVDYTGGPALGFSTKQIANEGNTYALKCSSALGEAQVTVKIGNRKSSKNPLPVISSAKISVCCAQPQRIALTTKPGASAKNIPSCPAFTHSVYHSRPAALQLVAWGVCGDNKDAEERLFDSLSAVKVKYSVAQTTLLSVKGLCVDEKQPSRHLATAVPKSQPATAKITAEATFGKQPCKASLILNLVDHAVALPPSLVLWNAKSVRGTSVHSGGSGHFWVDADSAAEHVSANIIATDGQAVLELHPTNQGLVKVPVFDLCIEGSHFDVAVKVTDVTAIRIQGPELVEVGAIVPLTIEVLDVEGHPFSIEDVKMMELNIEYSREVADLRANDLLSYDLKGTSVGTGAISAKVRSSTGQVVRSVPHQVQVFAPLRLLPSVVTPIPESVFQFEILGGPQAQQADVQFILNTSGIATVAQNGLITSNLNLGETAVTAAVTTGGSAKHIVTQDSAQIRVVSLAGIRIVVSSMIVEAGDRIWATIHGLDDAETPFAFGGAEYPLTMQWKLSSKDNLVFESPLTEIVDEDVSNRLHRLLLRPKSRSRPSGSHCQRSQAVRKTLRSWCHRFQKHHSTDCPGQSASSVHCPEGHAVDPVDIFGAVRQPSIPACVLQTRQVLHRYARRPRTHHSPDWSIRRQLAPSMPTAHRPSMKRRSSTSTSSMCTRFI